MLEVGWKLELNLNIQHRTYVRSQLVIHKRPKNSLVIKYNGNLHIVHIVRNVTYCATSQDQKYFVTTYQATRSNIVNISQLSINDWSKIDHCFLNFKSNEVSYKGILEKLADIFSYIRSNWKPIQFESYRANFLRTKCLLSTFSN